MVVAYGCPKSIELHSNTFMPLALLEDLEQTGELAGPIYPCLSTLFLVPSSLYNLPSTRPLLALVEPAMPVHLRPFLPPLEYSITLPTNHCIQNGRGTYDFIKRRLDKQGSRLCDHRVHYAVSCPHAATHTKKDFAQLPEVQNTIIPRHSFAFAFS